MPNYLTINRTYTDHDILYEADLDNICASIEFFLNTTKLNEDNLSPGITDFFAISGLIALFSSDSLPSGWLECNGAEVSQTTYAELYAVLGSTYNTGGETSGNFRLPDYRRRTAVGKGGTGTSVLGNAVGNSGGEELHVLASNGSTIPSHSHTDPGHTHLQFGDTSIGPGGLGTPGLYTNGTNNSGGSPFATTAFTSFITGITYNNTGGGGGHNNVQPSLVMVYMVKA